MRDRGQVADVRENHEASKNRRQSIAYCYHKCVSSQIKNQLNLHQNIFHQQKMLLFNIE